MSWLLNDKEMKAILALEAQKRYAHWIKKVADQEEVWSLWQKDQWALTTADAGYLGVPVWPHSKYAELCTEGIWAEYQPKSIPLDVWLNRWISSMELDQRLVAVFPTQNDRGFFIDPKRLEQDLREELSNYE